ncbi:sulfite oxidase heme-binding subunit YedZ [Castellaniella denitrificans]|uniref:Protein-methionine-sulfoxide reductase heme-binding subunit MsrQ n=1 Tax=Castellaniella denitrificans TaxID=56119 RepID=A0ABT4M578_9BURK|nr:protein-methionine-sulfoxide reductase heme-binding subunit MsrQ [Castellaniella denitrificans]MCZ4329276.1 sulfoxide reductase heme-binding subunit YedZ [Castellaniella denitrificans]
MGAHPIAAAARRPRPGGGWVLGACVHICGLFPLLRWIVLGTTGGLGVNPQEFLIRSSGLWALVLLWATLSVTPARRLGWSGLLRHRRKLGLYAFFYTVLHVLAWAAWDRGWIPASMWADLWRRDFIGVGALAVLCLIPLAVTSTHGWMRRLGRGWKRLHALVYPAAILSALHFDWMRAGKNDFLEPRLYALALGLLLAARLPAWWRGRRVTGRDRHAGPG